MTTYITPVHGCPPRQSQALHQRFWIILLILSRDNLGISKLSRSHPIWAECFVAFSSNLDTPPIPLPPPVTLATNADHQPDNHSPTHTARASLCGPCPSIDPKLKPLESQTPGSKTATLPANAVSTPSTTHGNFPKHNTIQGYSTRWRGGYARRERVYREPIVSRIKHVQSKRHFLQVKAKNKNKRVRVSQSASSMQSDVGRGFHGILIVKCVQWLEDIAMAASDLEAARFVVLLH